MPPIVRKMALILLLCLASLISNSIAVVAEQPANEKPTGACTPVIQSPVAPGDQIDLRGPDVSADQKALGITWDYRWIVRENDASGAIVGKSSEQAISFKVPAKEYAKNYYFDLMVTAKQAQLCINEACMSFPIVPPGDCKITTTAPSQICISDTGSYTYSTQPTPSQVIQRWYIFGPKKTEDISDDTSKLNYNSNEGFIGEGSSITVDWNKVADGKSGIYVVYSAYFSKKTYVYQGSCQMRVSIVAVPDNTIRVE
jgi:hypothetical protein